MSRLSAFFLLALAAALVPLVVSADSSSSASPPPFNFHDYLLGEWDVLKTSASFSPPSFDFSPYRGRYSFEKDNATANVLGRYFDNHTESGDIENRLHVLVDFEDTANGQWKTGRDEDSLTPLFDFSFVQHPAGHPTTVGEWHGADDAYYLLQINGPDRFTITVTPKAFGGHTADGEGEEEGDGVVVYSLKKTAQPVAKTFFQQYGTYLMLGVFFVVNMYMKSRGATAAATIAPPATTAVASKKSR